MRMIILFEKILEGIALFAFNVLMALGVYTLLYVGDTENGFYIAYVSGAIVILLNYIAIVVMGVVFGNLNRKIKYNKLNCFDLDH